MSLLAIVTGIDMLWHPHEAIVFHQVYRRFGYKPEYISKTGARIYGVFCLLFGLVLIRLVFSGRQK